MRRCVLGAKPESTFYLAVGGNQHVCIPRSGVQAFGPRAASASVGLGFLEAMEVRTV